MRLRKEAQLVGLFSFFLAVNLMLMTGCSKNEKIETKNTLLTGKTAQLDGAVEIPLVAPVELNFKTKAEVLNLRARRIAEIPNLASPYEPNTAVFGAIEDKKPWWGMHGSFVWRKGPRSTEGPSEESRFLANPYLLAAANSWSVGIWDSDKIKAADLESPDFPFCWTPTRARIWPKDNLEQVVYDVSGYQKALEGKWANRLQSQKPIDHFQLIAYNARDFGYRYVYVAEDKSLNVVNPNQPLFPVKIAQMIHCGGTCGCDGGCNNMSPAMANIDSIAITKIPARAVIWLWKNRPVTALVKPDMTVMLDFR